MISVAQVQAGARLEQRRRARQRHPLPLLAWVQQHRATLKPGIPFDLEQHQYLRAIYEDTAQRIVLNKAGQMGLSEYLVSYALHGCDTRGMTMLYIFPTEGHISDFSAARIGPAIEASDYLESIVVDGNEAGGKRGANRVTLKRIRDRFLYLRGAKVDKSGNAAQLKSVDADAIILDEVDEMDARAPEIAAKRLGHSPHKEERRCSTPTYAGVGIHKAYDESDQRQWVVACPHCGTRQPLAFARCVIESDDLERPVAWHGMAEGRAWIACDHCGKELDRLAPGEWAATYPSRDTHGYHITKLFSAQTELIDVVRALQTTDETKRKETINQDLAQPYKPRGGGLDDADLDALRRDYAHAATGTRNVMGMDVGKVLHVVIRARLDAETGERRQLFAGDVTSFAEAGRLLRQYRVGTCVVDALPETKKAREFQRDHRNGQVWLAYYHGASAGSKQDAPVRWDAAEGTVTADRTRTLDETISRFLEGANTLPAYARDVRDYYAHLKAPVRVVEATTRGEQVARYVETGADHFMHAENYCTIASLLATPEVPLAAVQAMTGSVKGWGG